MNDLDLDDDSLSVDLTPLIDVTFMLVIFFIMTMSFALPSIELNLPESATAQRQAVKTEALLVSISADGRLFYQQNEVTIDDLSALLQGGTFELIEVNLDRAAPAQQLISMADLARLYTGGRLQVNTFIADDAAAAPIREPGVPDAQR